MKVRRDALRLAMLGSTSFRHPTWTVAHIQNFVNRRRDRCAAYDALPPDRMGPTEVIHQLTGASPATIACLLSCVPQPRLRRQSVMLGNPDGSVHLTALVYACCRLLRPQLVIETGVANGFTTAVVLQALEENDMGALRSIDLPHLYPSARESIGAAVDPKLRTRWSLRLGPADRLLPVATSRGQQADLFIQDAAHTFRGQLAEYRAMWPQLRRGGLLISDDIGPAFGMFAGEVGAEPMIIDQPPKWKPIGVLRKCT